MDTEERLREALLELAQLRAREQETLREQTALLDGLEKISATASPGEAADALLESVKRSVQCDTALLLRSDVERFATIACTEETVRIEGTASYELLTGRKRRVPDLSRVDGLIVTGPKGSRPFVSMISTPAPFDASSTLVLVCLGRERGAFTRQDVELLDRFTQLAAQAIRSIQLAEQNVLLAEVISGSSVSISIADAADPKLPLIFVNDAFEILSGYARADVLHQNCRFLSAEEATSPERVRLREAVRNRQAGQFELRNRRADGEEFWNRLTLYPVSVGREQHPYLVATQEDITLARQIQEDRDAIRGDLMSALAGTREGFLIVDGTGAIRIANARFREFFGTGKGHFKPGNGFIQAWTKRLVELGEELETATQLAAARLSIGLAGTAGREEQLPDGRIVLINDTPILDGGFVSVVTEITSIKATERRLTERMIAIDSAQDGVAITDDEGRFIYLNPSHVTMFGYESSGELVGRSWTLLYKPAVIEQLQNVAMPILMRDGRWRGDLTGSRRDGSEIQQDVSLTRLDGGLICVTRDISDRVKGEAERDRLRDQLATAQRQEAIGQLSAGIAHDFNNVLAAISGSARLLEMDAQDTKSQEHIKRILSAGEQARGLISRMLEFGARKGRPERIDLRRPIVAATDLLRSGLPSTVSLTIDVPEEPVIAEADQIDVTQVVLNLVINARDAVSPEGSVCLRLDAEGLPAPDFEPRLGTVNMQAQYVALRVLDTGGGISDDNLNDVFEPYFSTKGNLGTGLGLSVVASIIAKAGGAISVDTSPHGTCFTVLWPTLNQVEQARVEHLPHHRKSATVLSGVNVIVVDDEPEVAAMIGAALERAGAEVAVCMDARDAIDAVDEDPEHWSLIVTDFDMPELNGADLAQSIRELRPGLPIVLCTALPDWKGRSRASPALFSRVISKPVDPAMLVDIVAECLNLEGNQEDRN
ncbi:MAG: PAS domain-containing protein [Pseudomonadota bacterium]